MGVVLQLWPQNGRQKEPELHELAVVAGMLPAAAVPIKFRIPPGYRRLEVGDELKYADLWWAVGAGGKEGWYFMPQPPGQTLLVDDIVVCQRVDGPVIWYVVSGGTGGFQSDYETRTGAAPWPFSTLDEAEDYIKTMYRSRPEGQVVEQQSGQVLATVGPDGFRRLPDADRPQLTEQPPADGHFPVDVLVPDWCFVLSPGTELMATDMVQSVYNAGVRLIPSAFVGCKVGRPLHFRFLRANVAPASP